MRTSRSQDTGPSASVQGEAGLGFHTPPTRAPPTHPTRSAPPQPQARPAWEGSGLSAEAARANPPAPIRAALLSAPWALVFLSSKRSTGSEAARNPSRHHPGRARVKCGTRTDGSSWKLAALTWDLGTNWLDRSSPTGHRTPAPTTARLQQSTWRPREATARKGPMSLPQLPTRPLRTGGGSGHRDFHRFKPESKLWPHLISSLQVVNINTQGQ